ncbi:MAG: hypothetical protein U0694_17930 [Anaerolineae bacterium]
MTREHPSYLNRMIAAAACSPSFLKRYCPRHHLLPLPDGEEMIARWLNTNTLINPDEPLTENQLSVMLSRRRSSSDSAGYMAEFPLEFTLESTEPDGI